jgi:DNA-binding CsgD family transcriptional regulator
VEPRIVGRASELQAAASFLSTSESGVLLFSGEAGIGKTTLWSAAVAEARARGCVVLSARVVEAESELAFATLTDLLAPIEEVSLANLPEPQRHALEVALLRVAPDERRLDLRAVGAATTGVLGSLAAAAPVVVAVDDLQWLDRSSARVLVFALRRLGDLPVRLVAAERSGGSELASDLVQVLPTQRLTRIAVGPLAIGEVRGLLQSQFGRALSRRTAAQIGVATGGNPFFALEIARMLPDELDPVAPLQLPANLVDLLEERMASLEAGVRMPLLIAASVSTPTIDVIAAVADVAPAEALAALRSAVDADIVEIEGTTIRFAHPLYAAALYTSSPAATRRAVHARCAKLLEGIEERARHMALAGDVPDEAIAAALDEAAEHARRRGAPDTAAMLAEHARRLTPAENRAGALRRTITAAEFHYRAGELAHARTALEQVLEDEIELPTRAATLRQLADVIAHQTSIRDAAPVYEEALALTDDASVAAAIELQLAFNANASGDFAQAAQHADRALELATPLGPDGGLAEALAVREITRFQLGAGVDERNLERALELEDPDRLVSVELRPSLIAGLIMLYLGRLEHAIELLERLRQRLLDRGDESSLPIASGALTWASCLRGHTDAAEAYAGEALECATRLDSEPLICWSLGLAAMAAAFKGDTEGAATHAQRCSDIAGRTGFGIAPLWASWATALVALARGDPTAAETALDPFVPPFEQHGVAEPILGFFLPDAIEAMTRTGHLDRAERLLTSFDEAAQRLDRGWARMNAGRCRALLASARGDLQAAAYAAAEATALGETVELRVEFARTLLTAGQIEWRRRRKRAAAELISRAAAIFDASGAALWATRARDELDRTTLRRARDNELTDAERRVATLAAAGHTNREVAAQLFVSTKTVEATLQRAYRKLGIRSRAELGARFPDASTRPDPEGSAAV